MKPELIVARTLFTPQPIFSTNPEGAVFALMDRPDPTSDLSLILPAIIVITPQLLPTERTVSTLLVIDSPEGTVSTLMDSPDLISALNNPFPATDIYNGIKLRTTLR